MTIRPMIAADMPKLMEMHANCGFEYEFPNLTGPLMESVIVVCDENNEPLMAAAAERMVQLYLFTPKHPPALMLRGVRLLHQGMCESLQNSSYTGANAFLPPQIDARFGRWLVRRFGWFRSWKAWGVKFK